MLYFLMLYFASGLVSQPRNFLSWDDEYQPQLAQCSGIPNFPNLKDRSRIYCVHECTISITESEKHR